MSIKFRSVADQIICKNRRRTRAVRSEWQKFNEEQIQFLQDLVDLQIPFSSFWNRYNISGMCIEAHEDFLEQCLVACIDQEEIFWPLFNLFEDLMVANKSRQSHFYESFMFRLVELDKADILHEVLSHIKRYSASIWNGLAENSPLLKAACTRNSFDLVKVLVCNGCRLYMPVNKNISTTWTRYTKLPTVFMPTTSPKEDLLQSEEKKSGDEINELHLLRLMTKPSYIIACFHAVVEAETSQINDGDGGKIHDFSQDDPNEIVVEATKGIEMRQHENKARTWSKKHDHDIGKPNINCKSHVECNDPIFRCFNLAKLAGKYADRVPEYREEYNEIADECRYLSYQLLDQCSNTDEVQTLLKEKTGCSTYFRYARYMRYPRLRLALEHGHKEFVGHVYCQQALRQEWHGSVEWAGAPITFKFIHCIVQMILAPLLAVLVIFSEVGRDIGLASKIPDNIDIKKAHWCKKPFLWFIQMLIGAKGNLDVPMNRFLVFSGYYMIFVMLVIFSYDYDVRDKDSFKTSHILLCVYVVTMLGQDFNLLCKLRWTFMKFWRVYDVLLHLEIFLSLLCRLLRTMTTAFKDMNDLEDCEAVCKAVGSTQAIMRLMFWLQLHEKIGPVVINMRRVVVDVFSLAGSYLLICLAFTTGLVFIMNTCDSHKTLSSYAYSFRNISRLLIWTVLDPGEPGDDDAISKIDGARGIMAIIIFIAYQGIMIIIVLNLLIAVMNATIQKYQDRKQLYWKFARTSVWIDYFDDYMALPLPFSIYRAPWGFIMVIKNRIVQSSKFLGSFKGGTSQEQKPLLRSARQKYLKLMQTLIQRHMNKYLNEMCDHHPLKRRESNVREIDNLKKAVIRRWSLSKTTAYIAPKEGHLCWTNPRPRRKVQAPIPTQNRLSQ